MAETMLPALGADLEPTRATLHAYAHAMGALPRIHAPAHPKWWHISLKVRPTGLTTDAMGLPGGGSAQLRLDYQSHAVVLKTSRGHRRSFSMQEGTTGTEFADQLIAAAADLGLEGDYVREKFENDEPRDYDVEAAAAYFEALVSMNQVFEEFRSGLEGSVGPLQLWPHGFDLAFEWFGSRVETHEEHGEVSEYPSQINLGFYPAGEAYIYSNPWPFESERLLGVELPHGAQWHTEGWDGSILPYAKLQGDPDAGRKIIEYATVVHEAAAPTLMA